jgi:hypothetical protein
MYRSIAKYVLSVAVMLLFIHNSASAGDSVHVKTRYTFNKLGFYAGMGVNLQNNSSFKNYLVREMPGDASDSVKSFNTGVEFFGGFEYFINRNFSMKLDYSYYQTSYSFAFPPYSFQYDLRVHQPYLIASYLIRRITYDIKIGAGAGLLFAHVDRQFDQSITSYSATGFGVRAEGVFAPYITNGLQAYLNAFVFGSLYKPFKDSNGNLLVNTNSTQQVDFSGFGVGARIGIMVLIK